MGKTPLAGAYLMRLVFLMKFRLEGENWQLVNWEGSDLAKLVLLLNCMLRKSLFSASKYTV